MICNMEFVDDGTYLSVSELTEDATIYVHMGAVGDELNSNFMSLGKPEIIRLHKFLAEAIELLE